MGNTELQGEFRGWRVLEDIGAGDGVPTECERCSKSGTPRQQFEHMSVVICYICADERVDELRLERTWASIAATLAMVSA